MIIEQIYQDYLDLAIRSNDMGEVSKIESGLLQLRSQRMVQFTLDPCGNAKEQAGNSILSINTDLYKCREYRQKVDTIILSDRNRMQVELAENHGIMVGEWIEEFGKKFSELWSQGVRDMNQFTLFLYGAGNR